MQITSAASYAFVTLQVLASWLLLVGGARRCQVEVNHYAVHNRIFANKWANRWLIEVISTVFVIQDYAGYAADHIAAHHRGEIFCGPNDPDWVFLRLIGLRPGMTRKQCWIWLLHACLSPSVHWKFLRARLKANFLSPNWYRRVMTLVWWLCVGALASHYDGWTVLLLVWVFPLTLLYQVSAIIQFTCEHKWASPFVAGESTRARQARLSLARYCLSPLPAPSERGLVVDAMQWLRWAVVVLCVDVPARVCIIVGDLPVHDRHHRFAAEKSWAAAIYLPEATDTQARSPEYWGLIGALNGVFDHLATLPAETGDVPFSS